jgi:molybdopterin converting factor small subunit
MRITVRLFSIARDIMGCGEMPILLGERATVRTVMDHLAGIDSRFDRLRTWVRFAVNYEYFSDDCTLADGDEVAILPPVSGG